MGWDLLAYIDIDQEKFAKFVEHHKNPDLTYAIDQWEDEMEIAKKYMEENIPALSGMRPLYEWNEMCEMYELHVSHHTSFIRDDDRFQNRRFIRLLEGKIGREFPMILENMNFSIRTREDALEAAEALEEFFGVDKNLMGFAGWLRATAPHCSTYELSY